MKKLSAATVFAQKLIIKKSVTPNDDGAIQVLKTKLSEIGFSNINLPFGSKKNNDLILNLFSVKNSKKLNNKILCGSLEGFVIIKLHTFYDQVSCHKVKKLYTKFALNKYVCN